MINIILADNHKLVCQGLKALLTTEPDFNIIGEVADGLSAIHLVESVKPDILVLDMVMPAINGLEVIRTLNGNGSKTGVIILSMQNCDAYVFKALAFGAKGYVLKEAPSDELVKAIREVMAGRLYLSSGIPSDILIQFQSRSIKEDRTNALFNMLTPREKEIALLITRGLCSKEIAKILFLSILTVDTHRANLMEKLNLHSHTQLVQFAVENGLIDANSDLHNN